MNKNTEHPSVSLPEQKNYDVSYGLALKLAAEKLQSLEKMQEQCRKSGSVCTVAGPDMHIQVRYLNRSFRISWPDMQISQLESPAPVEIRDKILILDYLNTAKGTPLSGKLIAFQELLEISNYYPAFSKRAVKPLIDYFGTRPQPLLSAAREMGGIKAEFGDASVTIPAFERIPITLVVWKADEEFPANANILFDSSIQDYLPAEDIIVLCQTIAWRLVKALPAGKADKPA